MRLLRVLWKVVLADWLAHVLVMLPAWWVLSGIRGSLANLPSDPAMVPAGDVALIVREALVPVAGDLGVAVAIAVGVWWLWTCLWYAGVVTWRVWSGGEKAGIAEVLGLGLVRFWSFLRLGLLSGAVLGLLVVGIWLPLGLGLRHAPEDLTTALFVAVFLAGVGVTGIVKMVTAAAGTDGAWRLAGPAERSAMRAWFGGVGMTLRHPVRWLGPVLGWQILAWAVVLAPLAMGAVLPGTRGFVLSVAMQTSLLIRSACRVGLLASFEPTLGLPPRSITRS
jgi:hypothetical protein